MHDDRYKWIALSNTTLGVLMATINSSIVLISLPAIFRGINIDPLVPQNVSYLLWMLMGYMVVTAVLVVSLGRVGDMFGRVRMYNLGFAVFTVASACLSFVFWQGPSAAITLIALRLVQGVGGAFLMANSAAILTDAFPLNQRGMALGINSVAATSGSFIGLVVGGLLADANWHLVFLVTVPIGIAGTIWAYVSLREIGVTKRAHIDWWGNITFALGLIALLVGITYGIQPYGTRSMGWTNPVVVSEIAAGVILLVVFCFIETRVREPMFRLGLFRVPAFSAGNLAGFLASVGRGGLMFMLIIWLQGIWLPYHGYTFESTPLWAAIYMLPMTAGFLIAGPLSGILSDRFGARPFATGGMIVAAATFALMILLPPNFSYAPFGLLLLANGIGMGLFASPNTAGIMNSVPPQERGVASGMRATFQNAAMNLSIGLFFSMMIAGLSTTLPTTLFQGLTAQGVPSQVADRVAHLPPVGSLFAAFLGYNPMQSLLGSTLTQLPPEKAAFITGKTFFPDLISGPFMHGMRITFFYSLVMMLIAAGASWLRGKRYVYGEAETTETNGRTPSAARPRPAAAVREQVALRPMIAISAAYGAAGGKIGRAVAERINVPFIDRAIHGSSLHTLADTLGTAYQDEELAADIAQRVLENLHEGSRQLPVHGAGSTSAPMDVHGHRSRVAEAIAQLADSCGAVILGHGAIGALRSDPRVLRVAVTAPLETRMARVMEMDKLDRETAHQRLMAADEARRVYLRQFHGIEPEAPGVCHLVLDTSVSPVDACVDLVVAAFKNLGAAV